MGINRRLGDFIPGIDLSDGQYKSRTLSEWKHLTKGMVFRWDPLTWITKAYESDGTKIRYEIHCQVEDLR
jgi:hypothetical protein